MTTSSLAQRIAPWTALKAQFSSIFGVSPTLYRASGRVNLIGEHTDYNDGFVMPAAIDLSCCVAIAPRDDRRLVVHSANYSETIELSLDDNSAATQHWSDYIRGVAWVLRNEGYRLPGAGLAVLSTYSVLCGFAFFCALLGSSRLAFMG